MACTHPALMQQSRCRSLTWVGFVTRRSLRKVTQTSCMNNDFYQCCCRKWRHRRQACDRAVMEDVVDWSFYLTQQLWNLIWSVLSCGLLQEGGVWGPTNPNKHWTMMAIRAWSTRPRTDGKSGKFLHTFLELLQHSPKHLKSWEEKWLQVSCLVSSKFPEATRSQIISTPF